MIAFSAGALLDALARSTATAPRIADPLTSLAIRRAAARSVASRWSSPVTTVEPALEQARGRAIRAGLRATDLARAARALDHGSLRERVGALSRAIGEVELRLDAIGAVDRSDLVAAIADRVAAGAPLPAELRGAADVVIGDIHDLDEPSLALFDAIANRLAQAGGSLRIELPHRETSRCFRFTRRMLDALERRGDRGAEIVPVDPVAEGIAAGRAGAALVRMLEIEPVDDDTRALCVGALSTWTGAHRAGEVSLVTRVVARALGRGTAPADVLVVMPDPDAHAPRIVDALDELGVPVDDRRGVALLRAPIVGVVLEALALVAEIDAERVGSLVARSYVTPPADAFALRAWLRASGARTDGDEEGATGAITRALLRFAEHLDRRGDPDRAIDVRVAARATAAWLEPFRTVGQTVPVGRLPAVVRGLVGHLAMESSCQDEHERAALGAVLDTVDRIPAAWATAGLGHELVPARELATLLAAVLANRAIPSIRAHGGGVRLVSLADAAGLFADTVVVVGVEDGALPARRSEDPWLASRDAAAVARALRDAAGWTFGLDRLQLGRGAPDEDELLFARALAGARREVVLTRAATDARGRPLAPSRLFTALVRAATRNGVAVDTRDEPPRPIPRPADAVGERELRRAMARSRALSPGAAPAPSELTPSLGALVADAIDRAVIERERRRAMRLGTAMSAWSGALDRGEPAERLQHALRDTASRTRPLSVTALGRAAQCAFRDLASRVLGLTDPEDTPDDVDPRLAGLLAHACIEDVLRRLARSPDARGAASERIATRITLRVIARWAAEHPLADPALFTIRARAIAEQVVATAVALADARPLGSAWLVEHAFGEPAGPDAWPALVLALPDGEAFLRGRIDLVERTAARALVTDFKRAARPALRRSLRRDALLATELQLPLYAAAVRRATGATDVDARAWSLRDGGPVESLGAIARGEGRTHAAADWRDSGLTLRDLTSLDSGAALERATATVLTRARAGHFPVAPRNDACSRCGFASVCRIPETLDDEEDDA
ncbi:MAG: PD-(D/E)XK nuclease family protein [Deltaproteobacteria bacterium]|nr:PD-(D/E)XK nuclease family protein [Deltaproteobacteria bacterium]